MHEPELVALPDIMSTMEEMTGASRGAPILILPHDIMTDVFLLALNTTTEHTPRSIVKTSPLTLSSVCRSWRSFALSFPSLWSRIYVRGTSVGLHGLRKWIERSGNLPLTIALSQVTNPYLKAVALHSSRWEEVTLSHIAPTNVKFLLDATMNSGYAPLLKRFSASEDSKSAVPHSKDQKTVLKVFQSRMRFSLTCLREFVVSNQYHLLLPNIQDMQESTRPDLIFESQNFHALRRLCQPRLQLWEECHAILILFPNLEELEMYINFKFSMTYPPCPVTHSNLKKLCFWLDECCFGDTLHFTISHLHLPSLEELHIAPHGYFSPDFPDSRTERSWDYLEQIDEGPWGAVVSMLKRSDPPSPLHTIHVFVTPLAEDLQMALPFLPYVKSFGLIDRETFESLVDASILPYLVELVVQASGITPESVVDLFESRMEGAKFRKLRYFSEGMEYDWNRLDSTEEMRTKGFLIEEIGS